MRGRPPTQTSPTLGCLHGPQRPKMSAWNLPACAVSCLLPAPQVSESPWSVGSTVNLCVGVHTVPGAHHSSESSLQTSVAPELETFRRRLLTDPTQAGVHTGGNFETQLLWVQSRPERKPCWAAGVASQERCNLTIRAEGMCWSLLSGIHLR